MITREEFEALKKLPFFKSKVVTGSMLPIIQIGDNIAIDVGNMDIKRFDIVVIYVDGKLICHYLWSMNKIVKPKLLQTRSMSTQLDFPVREEDYLGKVVSHKIGLWQRLKQLF